MMAKNTLVVMMSMLSTMMILSRRSCVVSGRRNSPAFVAGVHRQQQQQQQKQFTAGAFAVSSNQLKQQQQSIQSYSSTWSNGSLLRPKMTTALSMSTTAEEQVQSVEPSTSSASTTSTLVGIDWVREVVVTALNDIFDPKEIAKNAAIAKLDGKKKKKKNKKKKNVDESATNQQEEEKQEPKMSEEERNSIIQAAVDAAQPFTTRDAMVTPATKPEFGDYQCNAAMSLAKSAGLNPRECAAKIVDKLRPLIQDYMEEPEIAGPGFINFRFKEEYLSQALGVMVKDSMGRLGVPEAR